MVEDGFHVILSAQAIHFRSVNVHADHLVPAIASDVISFRTILDL
jgi:hypothetical protein